MANGTGVRSGGREAWAGIVAVLLAACGGGGGGGQPGDAADAVAVDLATDRPGDLLADPAADLPGETLADAAVDAAPDVPASLPLRAGYASRPLPAPVGIAACGFFVPGDSEGSPFAASMPSSRGTFMLPDIKVLVLEGGPGRVVLVRNDLMGIFSRWREAVLQRVRERTGRDLSDALVVTGTHTHSGPAAMYQGALDWMTDTYRPEVLDRWVGAVTDAIVQAFDDLEPVRVGWTVATEATLHADRRCNNPALQSPDLLLLRVDRADGQAKALVVNYAIHGTVLHPVARTLSPDVSGAIERKVQATFDHPVPVLFVNAWAADMAPSDPHGLPGTGDPDFAARARAGIARIGDRAAATIRAALPAIATTGEADVRAVTLWAPIDRDRLGYPDGVFEHPDGAICDLNGAGNCWVEPGNPMADLDQRCLDLDADPPLTRKLPLTVAVIGDLALATFPGEATTALGLGIRDDVLAATGARGLLFAGYAQDFLFYSLPEWDWWQGGYEASFSLWGPRQGDYLRARIAEVARRLADPAAALSFVPETPAALPDLAYTPRVPTPSLDAGKVLADRPGGVVIGDEAAFTFAGGDPGLGTPLVTVEEADKAETAWKPVLRPDGTPMSSDNLEIRLDLAPDPAWAKAPPETPRTFAWTATLDTNAANALRDVTLRPLRLRFSGRAAGPGGVVADVNVVSGTFRIGIP